MLPLSPELSGWLKGTILGILVPGVVGSIVAYVLIELAKYSGKRLLLWTTKRAKTAGKWLLASNLRPFARTLALVAKYSSAEDHSKLVVWATGTLVSFWVTAGLFIVAVVATVALAIHLGVTAPVLLAFMIGVTSLLLIFLVRDLADVLAVHFLMFYRDVKEIDEHLKADDSVIFFSALVVGLDAAFAELEKKSDQEKDQTTET